MKYTKEQIKAEYVRLYGEFFDDIMYKTFDEAFDSAWKNWVPKWNTDLEGDLYDIVVNDFSESSEFTQRIHPPGVGWQAEEQYLASQRRIWEEEERKKALLLQKELEEIKKYELWQEENLVEWEEE